MSTADTDRFVARRVQVLDELREFTVENETRRTEFQKLIRDILSKDTETGFFLLGDAYHLQPDNRGDADWRRRDINRLPSRYREDRPIEDAKWWAKTALIIALIALVVICECHRRLQQCQSDRYLLARRRSVERGGLDNLTPCSSIGASERPTHRRDCADQSPMSPEMSLTGKPEVDAETNWPARLDACLVSFAWVERKSLSVTSRKTSAF